jgi:hypothetical protein
LKFKDDRANRQGPADQVRTLIRSAREITDGVDPATFNRRPPDGGWSAAECLDHLNATARVYLPVLTEAMEEARASGKIGRATDGRTLQGRIIARMQEPPVRFLKSTTFEELRPSRDLDPEAVLEEFEVLYEELIVRINESASLDRKRIRIRSVLSPRLKLSLADWFAFLAAHARRHLWQADRVLSRVATQADSP